MAACWKNYHCPKALEDALALLAGYGGAARVVGGGTDLILELQQGRRPLVEALVDVTRIRGADRMEEEDNWIVIGCGVPHARIVADERIVRRGTCLAEACAVIGGPQVRNVATLAGNVAHALPAGDGTIGLLALDGEIEVAAAGTGGRWLPLAEGFRGPGESGIDRTREVLSRLRFPAAGRGEGSAFCRVMRPQGVALPILAMAAWIALDGRGAIRTARIALGPAGPTPMLATTAMDVLTGAVPVAESFAAAAEAAAAEARLRTSKYRATADYRARIIRGRLPALLATAARRAAAGGGAGGEAAE